MEPQQNPDSSEQASRAIGDRSALARVESSLKERRAELTRMMAEMRELYHSGKSQAQVEIESLRNQKLQLQQQLDQRAQELSAQVERSRAAEAHAKETEEHYHQVLAEAEAALADHGAEIGRLMAEFKQSTTGSPSYPAATLSQAEGTTLPPQVARETVQSVRKIQERDEEIKLLRAELVERDQLIQEFHAQQYAARLTTATHPVEMEKLRGQLAQVQDEHKAAQEKLASMAPAGEVEKLKGELVRMREQLQEANRKVAATVTMVPAAEAEKLRSELVRTREQLQDAKNKVVSAPTQFVPTPAIAPAELDNLRKETNRLKIEIAEKEKALQHSVPASDVEKLIAELGRARGEVARLQQGSPAASNGSEIEQLRAELTILQEESREKDRKLEEVHAAVSEPHPTDDARVAQYEAELIRYHRQLETDRQTLNQSIEELEKRNAELAQAAQKAQQDLSGERAQLNQLRDELHIDLAFEDLAFLARKHLAPIQPAKKK
ncbi:MAG TPA: hypothetical protein VGP68_20180 [Gemmataceae bacterium]|nr:hypothetical protein [Gemmataceae bacterium]